MDNLNLNSNPDKYYIVYMFRSGQTLTTRYIIGIYDTEVKALQKQHDFCGDNYSVGYTGTIDGIVNGVKVITWIEHYTPGEIKAQR